MDHTDLSRIAAEHGHELLLAAIAPQDSLRAERVCGSAARIRVNYAAAAVGNDGIFQRTGLVPLPFSIRSVTGHALFIINNYCTANAGYDGFAFQLARNLRNGRRHGNIPFYAQEIKNFFISALCEKHDQQNGCNDGGNQTQEAPALSFLRCAAFVHFSMRYDFRPFFVLFFCIRQTLPDLSDMILF